MYVIYRVLRGPVYQHLKVQVATETVSGITDQGYSLSLIYQVSNAYKELAAVRVSCYHAWFVFDLYTVAVGSEVAGSDDLSSVRGVDRIACSYCKVYMKHKLE